MPEAEVQLLPIITEKNGKIPVLTSEMLNITVSCYAKPKDKYDVQSQFKITC